MGETARILDSFSRSLGHLFTRPLGAATVPRARGAYIPAFAAAGARPAVPSGVRGQGLAYARLPGCARRAKPADALATGPQRGLARRRRGRSEPCEAHHPRGVQA